VFPSLFLQNFQGAGLPYLEVPWVSYTWGSLVDGKLRLFKTS